MALQQQDTQDMPTNPAQLLARFEALGISYDMHEHEAVFTVAESAKLDIEIPGTHCRNLFLCDKKKVMYLVVAANETAIDLKKLAPLIGAGRLSFGSPERLWTYLGVRPGSVCPFAIINDTNCDVHIILDAAMMAAQRVNYHPLDNRMTVGMAPSDLVRFIEACGREAKTVDLSPAAPEQESRKG